MTSEFLKVESTEVSENRKVSQRGRRFDERGHANQTGASGIVTVLSDLDGKPLTLGLIQFEYDNAIGGSHYLWSSDSKRDFQMSHTSTDGLYSAKLTRKGMVSTCKIEGWTGKNGTLEKFFEGECAIVISHDDKMNGDFWKVTFDNTMLNGTETSKLVSEKLGDLITAGINRSYDSNPENIYFGKIALDVKGIKKIPYNKEKKVRSN